MSQALFDNLETIRQYIGNPFLYALYLPAFVYLLRKEQTKWKRVLLLYVPAAILILFLLPPSRMIYERLLNDAQTYYRILWLAPFAVTILYAGVTVFGARKRIGLIAIAAVIVLCGRLTYASQYVTKAENRFHLPQIVLSICDTIMPAEGEERVTAAFPPEMAQQVRQYTTRIKLAYGRDIIAWRYYNPVYELMVVPDVVEPKALADALRDAECAYLILSEHRAVNGSMTDEGFEEYARVGGYVIYKDSLAE